MALDERIVNSEHSEGIQFRVTILAESLRHFSGLALGETAAILSEAKVDTRECLRRYQPS
jgi:hypothetical protein